MENNKPTRTPEQNQALENEVIKLMREVLKNKYIRKQCIEALNYHDALKQYMSTKSPNAREGK
jgi:hypothetical protein